MKVRLYNFKMIVHSSLLHLRFFITFICLTLFLSNTYASPPKGALHQDSYPISEIKFPKKDYSLIVLDLESGKVITSHQEKEPMILASVSKLFTSIYALRSLGVDYQFQVTVHTSGKVKGGVLLGDLYLKSNGAPYLLAPHIVSIIQQIQSQGIYQIKGNFYLDDTALAFTERLSPLGLEDQTDNPSMGALNIEFNRFRVWKQKEIHPPLEAFKITSSPISGEGVKFSHLGPLHWEVKTKEKIKNWEEIPSRDSTMYTGHFFHYLANLHGLKLSLPSRKKVNDKAKIIAFYKGLTTPRLVQLGLEYSNNLISETLLKASTKQRTGKVFNSNESASYMHQWLQSEFKNVNWQNSHFENGSGLTIKNKVTALTMVQYLQEVANEKFKHSTFWSLLSINGHSGGIRKRLRDPKLAYRIYAKTGSLHYVNNLAGYFIAKSNKKYAFALFFTDQKKRNLLNAKNSKAQNKLRYMSKRWYRKTQQLQDSILKEWIQSL